MEEGATNLQHATSHPNIACHKLYDTKVTKIISQDRSANKPKCRRLSLSSNLAN